MTPLLAVATTLQIAGWTALHSLWQGAFVALLVAWLLRWVRSPHARHRLAIGGALMILLASMATFVALRTGVWPHVDTWQASHAPGWPLILETTVNAWIVLAALLAAHGAMACFGLVRLRRTAGPIADAALFTTAQCVCREAGLSVTVAQTASRTLTTPVTFGVFRPIVLFPQSCVERLSPREFTLVLRHELEHVRRGDFAWNLLLVALESALPFHPGAWWLTHQARIAAEEAADDGAARDDDPRALARALLSVEQSRSFAHRRLALASSGPTLRHRVARLVEPMHRAVGGISRRELAAMLLMFGVGAACAACFVATPKSSGARSGVSDRFGALPSPDAALLALPTCDVGAPPPSCSTTPAIQTNP